MLAGGRKSWSTAKGKLKIMLPGQRNRSGTRICQAGAGAVQGAVEGAVEGAVKGAVKGAGDNTRSRSHHHPSAT